MIKCHRTNLSSHTAAFSRLIIVLLAALASSPSLLLADQEASEKPRSKGIPVEVVPVERQTIRAIVYGQGTARAAHREFLTFEAEGKITFIKKGPGGRDLAAGDPVKGPEHNQQNGELLASVDSRDSLAQLDVTQATVEQARQQQIAAGTDLDRARADQQVAVADLKRMRNLIRSQAISRSDLEKSEATAKQAEATVNAAKAGVKTAISAVTAAEAQQVQAQLALERTSIFAPINGIISFLNIDKGQYFSMQRVNTNSEASALKTVPIVVIDPSEFEIVLDLPTFQGTAVKPGQKVYIFTGELLGNAELKGISDLNEENGAIEGSIFSVSPSINPGGRSIQVKVRTRQHNQTLNDGMFVNCWLVVKEHKEVVVLPYNTLLHEGRQAFVYVVDKISGVVERRPVSRGIRGLHGVEIVSGLKAGEQVVGKGRNRLTHGTPVEVVAVRGDSAQ